MAKNDLQRQNQARMILVDLRNGLPSSHIEGWLKVKRLSDFLRAKYGATITQWREHAHSIITFQPVSDDLEELQIQRSSLARLESGDFARAKPTSAGSVERKFSHRDTFTALTRNPTAGGAAVYDKVHKLVHYIVFPKLSGQPVVQSFPYDEVKAELEEYGIRLQHVRTNVAFARHLLKVY
ncbi:hypothetical protein [Erwinia phage vB_Ea277G]|nr:hypothetical protein [Erwinia phage vB_Ea277G]